MLAHALNPSTWKAEADESSSLRPAWTIELVPGQTCPHRGPCLKKQKDLFYSQLCVSMHGYVHASDGALRAPGINGAGVPGSSRSQLQTGAEIRTQDLCKSIVFSEPAGHLSPALGQVWVLP